jgi:formylglycine-generating enzyme required for sulfatase activity/serine/threonine protein kinase
MSHPMETTPISTQTLPAGTRIEEFVIEKVLGSGGFGITYLARDTSLGRQVVIKENLPAQFAWRETTTGTVRPRHTTGGDGDDFEWSMNNFLKEAETLASLEHPGIVRVLRKFEANGTAYFVMPFVDGKAFDTLIDERRAKGQAFSEEELKGCLSFMLDALGYLHDRGIYHRDIKPGNILISTDGVPTLIDFGSARQRLSERSMTVVESAGYTPFEQLQSRGNVGPWSDLYALGGTLVKAITFETPPKANDRAFNDPWRPLAQRADLRAIYSAKFLSGIDRALAIRIENRWKDAGVWARVLQVQATMAVPAPFTERPDSPPVISSIPEGKASPMSWVIAACAIFGLVAWAIISSSNMKTEAATSQAKEAEQRAALAEQEQQALASQAKEKVEAAKQAAEQQREAELAKANEEAAKQAAEQQREAELAKAKEEAANKAAEQQRLAELAKAKEDAAKQEAEQQRLDLAAAKAAKVIQATKDQPFVNSLRMKFVPAGTPGVLFSVWETRVQDFRAFVDATGHDAIKDGPNGMPAHTLEAGATWKQVGGTWKDPRFPPSHGQNELHPVVCVSYLDAEAFCAWLTKRDTVELPSGWRYRLPTDAEWSGACGPAEFPWGETGPPGRKDGNYSGTETMIGPLQGFSNELSKAGRSDGWARTAPVGSFTPNRYGLFDMGGNVWEWCASWYKASMNTANTLEAMPWLREGGGGSTARVLRGGSWYFDGRVCMRSAFRGRAVPDNRWGNNGFRVVLVSGGG